MKKIMFLGLMISSLFVLAACSKTSATAELDNFDITYEAITFDVTVDDPESEITGDTYVKIYDEDGEVVDSTLLSFDDGETSLEQTELEFDGLDVETDYILKVVATIEKKNVTLATYDFTTQSEDDIVISTAAEFIAMSSNRSGNYVLANDIDFTDVEYTMPFPSGKSFLGTFDGQGFTISNIDIPALVTYTGVFGNISTGSISNLVLDSITIGSETEPFEITTSTRVGFLTGYMSSSSGSISDITISNSSMYVKSSSSITAYFGGVIGELRGEMTNVAVVDSNIYAETLSYADTRIGGVAGYLYEDAVVSQVSSSGLINFTLTGDNLGDANNSYVDIGGVIGKNDATDSTDSVTELYSTMDIEVSITYQTLEETTEANYSLTVGGLVGFSSAMIKEGFYSGSIDITQVASEFETAAQIRYYVGGL
ncbi:MAG: hypothetical protein WCR19_06770, partial [Acholeplasmataceae bacterium]